MAISGEFRLGNLVTEAQHPRDTNLSEVAGKDIAAGLAELFDIDKDVVETCLLYTSPSPRNKTHSRMPATA